MNKMTIKPKAGYTTELAELLVELLDHANKYGSVPKSADKLWSRVESALAKAGII